MSELLSAVFVWFSVLFPPALSGPAAAVAFYWVIQRRERRLLRLYWILLPLANITSFVWMALTMGDVFGPGSAACILTPFAALAAAFILVLLHKRVSSVLGDEVTWRRAFRLGTLLIPALQLAMLLILMVVAPLLCELGVRSCSDW